MRGKVGRILRHYTNDSNLGSVDWGAILGTVAEAAPAVISAVSKPKPTATTQPTSTTNVYKPATQKGSDNNLTIPLIIGGLGLGGLYLINQSNKKK